MEPDQYKESGVSGDSGIGRGLNSILAGYRELLLPIGLLLVVATLFLPLQPWAMSVLVILNIAISVMILVTALLVKSPAQLTSYPTILLLSTIFRLTISVSITRNILTYADAGEVVNGLGQITAQGSILTGAVMFVIILVVQYMVVGRGAERVAEVAARFTLDSMPGKQMAIDADLRAGYITRETAVEMRSNLSKESQLHGAMDGAMKFVRGDSVATIIIAIVNITAGLAIGISGGMSPGEAAQVYMILTFGDGLAAIISSLLVTISAGIVVTRISSSDTIGSVGGDIAEQLFSNPRPLFVTGGVMLLLTPLNLLFVPVGAAAIGGGYLLRRREIERESLAEAENPSLTHPGVEMTHTVPMAIAVSEPLNHLVDNSTEAGQAFRKQIPLLRSALYNDLGVMAPYCFVSGDAPLEANEYHIAIKEIPIENGRIVPGCVFVNDSAENIRVFGIEGTSAPNPADLGRGCWIKESDRELAEASGLKVWEPNEVMILHLSRIMQKYAAEFLGIQEAQGYIDFVHKEMPRLVDEVIPGVVTMKEFTDVLQRLVKEGISIRDTKSILEAISEHGQNGQNTADLTEDVRSSLKRVISFQYSGGSDVLYVYLLDPEIDVRPSKNQIDDLLEEIDERVKKKERVLVTTLTKRMAEELTKYLERADVKCRYIHSEVKTLDRVEILRELRLGIFDVLVGVNLLREGLD